MALEMDKKGNKKPEVLKVDITIDYNGEKKGAGFDFSNFLNDGRKLDASYVERVLTEQVVAITRTLRRMQLVHPYEILERK